MKASMLINQARNLTSLPTSTLSQIQQSMDRTRQLIGEAQQIAYNVRDIDRAFDQRYPAGSLSGTSNESLVTNAEERWRDAVGSFQDALRTQATVVTNLGDTRREIDKIGRAHVCTPVTNAHLVCRLLLEKKKNQHK